MSVDVDREIDGAVREMLDADGRSDLRARVIEHIEQPPPSRGWMRIAAPLAVAAVVVLAVMLRPSPPQPRGTTAADLPAEARNHDRGEFPPAEAGSHDRGETPLTEAGSHDRGEIPPARPGRHEAVIAWLPPSGGRSADTVELAPLAAPAPITVSPVQPRPLEQPEVRIASLPAIAPIAVEPLPGGGRH